MEVLLRRLRATIGSLYWGRAFSQGGIQTWMAEPASRRAINTRVTGSPTVWPIEWLAAKFPSLGSAVSLGCGDGALERDLASKRLCTRILGLDLSEAALKRASVLASGEPSLAMISYARADLNDLLLPVGEFDAAFFHHSLHHVERLEECLACVSAALKPGGLLYLDEYVGPSRSEWNHALMERAQHLFDRLPPHVKRRGQLQLPVDWKDPTEAVRSAEILEATSEYFTFEELRPYGGNLMAVIHPHLRFDKVSDPERDLLLQQILSEEEVLLGEGVSSFCVVGLARPRAIASPGSR